MSRKLTIETYRRHLREREGRPDLLTNYVYQTTLKRYADLIEILERSTDDRERVKICHACDIALNNLLSMEARGRTHEQHDRG